jgi:tetratricopeptide (TPR) repeat protein
MSSDDIARLSRTARGAVRARDWATVRRCARKILKTHRNDAEGYFLDGLAQVGTGQVRKAVRAFTSAIAADDGRYDAAIELMRLHVADGHHADAFELLERFETKLANSPYYLEMAAIALTDIGLHERAWRLYRRATDLQPEVERFRAGLASCSVLIGKVDEARSMFAALLGKHPGHQRYHYELSKLAAATDDEHVKQMEAVLDAGALPHEKNIFLYYALGKELEDLGRWDEAFHYLSLGGDAAKRSSGYDVQADLDLIDTVIRTCTSDWLASGEASGSPATSEKTPIFVVGLPRTGTTLVERIIASQSQVKRIDETQFIELALKKLSSKTSAQYIDAEIIEAAAESDAAAIAKTYIECVDYRLGQEPFFIDKYPENFSYLGFIARAFPEARLVQVTRHPMDACFAMYKQSYFRYAYTLEDVGEYYVAYRKLRKHWQELFGSRLISIAYESLVDDQEGETRALLEKLGLPFEEQCLRFHENRTPSATASAVQVREKVHSRSVGRWKKFAEQLRPLQQFLEEAGVDIS